MVSRFIINFLEMQRRNLHGVVFEGRDLDGKFQVVSKRTNFIVSWLESYVFLLFEKCKVPDTRLALHNCRREIYNTAAV